MTQIPDRNVEIAMARAYYESEVEFAKYPEGALSWGNLPIAERARRANVVNHLIISGLITPGEKLGVSHP